MNQQVYLSKTISAAVYAVSKLEKIGLDMKKKTSIKSETFITNLKIYIEQV